MEKNIREKYVRHVENRRKKNYTFSSPSTDALNLIDSFFLVFSFGRLKVSSWVEPKWRYDFSCRISSLVMPCTEKKQPNANCQMSPFSSSNLTQHFFSTSLHSWTLSSFSHRDNSRVTFTDLLAAAAEHEHIGSLSAKFDRQNINSR